jgi:hypothetical protein
LEGAAACGEAVAVAEVAVAVAAAAAVSFEEVGMEDLKLRIEVWSMGGNS